MANEIRIVVTAENRAAAGVAAARATVRELTSAAPDPIRIRVETDNAADAAAELRQVREAAEGIPRETNTRVTTDTSSVSDVDTFRRRADEATRPRRFRIDGDTAATVAGVMRLAGVIASLVPAALAASGAIAGIGVVGLAGFAAVAGGFSGIGNAMTAMGEKASAGGGAVGASASAVRSATRGVEAAQRDLRDSYDDVTDAAYAAAGAHRAVTGAQTGVEDSAYALAQAIAGVAAANQRVSDSEAAYQRSLADEQRAQAAVADARKAALRTLQDLEQQTKGAALSQEDAALSVAEAVARRNEVMADPRASDLEKSRADLSVRMAKQRQEDLSISVERLAEDKAEADAKGVDGSDQVTAANQRVQAAQDAVAASARGVEQAQAGVAAAERDVELANRGVAEAQQRVADSQHAAAEADQALAKAREGTVLATQRLADAQLALKESQSSGGGGGGVDKMAEAFAKLGPNAQAFVRFLRDFVDNDLKKLRQAGQEAFLPGIQSGLQRLKPIMESLRGPFAQFSGTLGKALGDLIPIIGQMAGPFLKLANSALKGLAPMQGVLVNFVAQMSAVFGQLASSGVMEKAMNGLVDVIAALLPVLPALIDAGVQLMAAMGPSLAKVIEVVADALVGLLGFIADHPQVLVAFGAAFLAISAVMAAVSAPMTLLITGISALVGALVWFFTETDAGKTIVKTVWEFLKGLGEEFKRLGPIINQVKDFLVSAFKENLPQIMEIWEKLKKTVGSVMEYIHTYVKTAVDVVISLWGIFGDTILANARAAFGMILGVISGALDIIRGIFNVFTGLLTEDWVKVWDGIKTILSGAWKVITSIISGAWTMIRNNIALTLSLVSSAISGTWDKIVAYMKGIPGRITGAAKGMWDGVLSAARSVFNAVARLWNSTLGKIRFTVPTWIPGVGGASFAFPQVPMLANGGIIKARPGGQMFIGGEAGEDEVVAPLSRLANLGGGRTPVIIEFHGGNGGLDDLLFETLRRGIRVRGGNVQLALGQGEAA